MSAEITPERIARMRRYPCISDVDDLLDALEPSRAEVQRLKRERDAAIDERNAWRSGDQDSRIEADMLRGEVQRLTAWVQQAGLPSIPVAMAPDGIASIRVENYKVERIGDRAFVWVDADEVRRLLPLTEEAHRSDAGRVEVPVMSADDLEVVYDFTVHYVDKQKTADNVNTWFRSRLSPSPQPATGAVLTCDDCDSREGCPKRGAPCMYHVSHSDPQPSADVVVVPREEWREQAQEEWRKEQEVLAKEFRRKLLLLIQALGTPTIDQIFEKTQGWQNGKQYSKKSVGLVLRAMRAMGLADFVRTGKNENRWRAT